MSQPTWAVPLVLAALAGCSANVLSPDAGVADAGVADAGGPDARGPDAGVDGGRLTIVTSDDGKLTLEISEAAGVDPSTIVARRRTAAELSGRSDVLIAYELTPDGTRFMAPVTVRFRGSAADLGYFMDDAGYELVGPYFIPGLIQTDGGKEALATPTVAFELSDGGASFSGTLTHFTEVSAILPDHERFAARFAIGFLGLQQLPLASESPSMPLVGLRYWYTKLPDLPAGLGLPSCTGTQEVTPPQTFAGTSLHGGIPIALAASRHYAFQNIPEISLHGAPLTGPSGSIGSTTFKALCTPGPEVHLGFLSVPELSLQVTVALGLRARGCTETRTGPGASTAGRSLGLGQLHGLSPERMCQRAVFGLTDTPTTFSTGTRTEASTNPSTTALGTTVVEPSLTLYLSSLSALYYFSVLSCGANEWGRTVCPSPPALPPEGSYVVLSTVMGGDIPLADPTNRFIYAFVFDSDGVEANNYRAPPNYPKDFYDGTDRWYEASYVPGTGWALTAKTARGGAITAVPTAARLVLSGDTIFFIAPRSEFDVDKPKWRFTAFRHKGDYGLTPPYDWNGDVEPPVGMPLNSFP